MTALATIYGKENLAQILFVTCILGGGTAWMAAQSLAKNWHSLVQTAFYLLLLTAGIRFAHFALFQADPFSVPGYLVDAGFILIVGGMSWRIARVTQMVTQYRWLYERTSPFGWRSRKSPNIGS